MATTKKTKKGAASKNGKKRLTKAELDRQKAIKRMLWTFFFAFVLIFPVFRLGFFGVTVVDTNHIGKDDKRVGSHHRGKKSSQFVVVGKHQFGNTYGIVFVDNGYHAVFEHHADAVALVEVVAAGLEILLGGEHLPADDSPCVEEFVVAADQLHLPDGREELAGRNGVDASDAGFEQAAARGHGARRDEDELRAGPVQARQLVHERRDARGVGPSVLAGEHIAADLDDDAAVFFRFTIHNSQFKIASSGQTDSVACPPPLPSLRGA